MHSLPLIAASILAKKSAESLDALLLHVHYGPGTLAGGREDADALAEMMLALAASLGIKAAAMLTDLATPFGRSVGDWLEIKEAVACLSGQASEDVEALALESVARLQWVTGKVKNLEEGRALGGKRLHSGQALQKWYAMLRAQRADMDQFEEKLRLDHAAPVVVELPCEVDGFVSMTRAVVVGEVLRDLREGCDAGSDRIHDVGIDRLAKVGDKCSRGSLLARVHAPSREAAALACRRLRDAFKFCEKPLTDLYDQCP
jgi:thymidine phosphorylase